MGFLGEVMASGEQSLPHLVRSDRRHEAYRRRDARRERWPLQDGCTQVFRCILETFRTDMVMLKGLVFLFAALIPVGGFGASRAHARTRSSVTHAGNVAGSVVRTPI